MTRTEFNSFYDAVRANWDKSTGLLVKLVQDRDDSTNLRLCIGPLTNRGLVAETCIVWEDDSIVYKGVINSVELSKVLTAKKVCGAIFTNTRLAAAGGRKLESCCYADACKCGRKCSIKSRQKKK